MARSARAAGVHFDTAYAHRKTDKQFARQWKRALREAGDHLEHEAWRRAVKGVTEPVYQLGKLAGYVRKYSDTLLIFLLKGCRPGKFRDWARVEHTGRGGGPIRTRVDHEHRQTIDYDQLAADLERFAALRGGAGGANADGAGHGAVPPDGGTQPLDSGDADAASGPVPQLPDA